MDDYGTPLSHPVEECSECAALRQRVEELERVCGVHLDEVRRAYAAAEAAEAKLAKVVEAGSRYCGLQASGWGEGANHVAVLARALLDFDAALATAKGE